jgi:2-dehydro-3-deoxygluconokinase
MKTNKKVVAFGEIMLRLGTYRYERFIQARKFEALYTGAETNVCVSLANFGVDSFIVSKIPSNEIGQACINYIRSFGVNTDYILRGGKRLGLFYLETGYSQRPSKVIYDRAGSAITELKEEELNWINIFQGKDWFHFSGITPALAENVAGITRKACNIAKNLGLTVSCDLNYRQKLWSQEEARTTMSKLMEFVDVLICNEEDAEMVFGIKAEGADVKSGQLNAEKYKDVAWQLHKNFNLKYVAITLRESISATINNWAGLLYDGNKYYTSGYYEMHIVDRVGGGDSFAGGLIYGLITGMRMQDVIEFATAASCLKHSIHGDFNLVSLEEVEMLMKGDKSGRVQR